MYFLCHHKSLEINMKHNKKMLFPRNVFEVFKVWFHPTVWFVIEPACWHKINSCVTADLGYFFFWIEQRIIEPCTIIFKAIQKGRVQERQHSDRLQHCTVQTCSFTCCARTMGGFGGDSPCSSTSRRERLSRDRRANRGAWSFLTRNHRSSVRSSLPVCPSSSCKHRHSSCWVLRTAAIYHFLLKGTQCTFTILLKRRGPLHVKNYINYKIFLDMPEMCLLVAFCFILFASSSPAAS